MPRPRAEAKSNRATNVAKMRTATAPAGVFSQAAARKTWIKNKTRNVSIVMYGSFPRCKVESGLDGHVFARARRAYGSLTLVGSGFRNPCREKGRVTLPVAARISPGLGKNCRGILADRKSVV